MRIFAKWKIILDEADFQEITDVETKMVEMFKDKYGNHSLNQFGTSSYSGSLTSIMFDYWRSFLAVKFLVEAWADGDVHQVFKAYHTWHEEGRKKPLTEYFGVENLFD